ncbi:MAG: hypothetical protein AAB361_03670 [Patescibacteria group bacterium]
MFTIVTHKRPHIDEVCAIWLLQKFGEKMFPGISETKITFAGAGGEDLEGFSSDEFESEGVVLVGIGGGKFDEHPGVKTFGKPDECASTLVAKELGIESEPALEKILNFVKKSDLKAGNQPFDLSNLVKSMHHAHPNDPAKVINWVMLALDSKYQEQVHFIKTKSELANKSVTEEIQGPGRKIKMVSGISDSEQFNNVCRNKGAAIVIQRRSSGNTQIYTSNREGLVLYDVAQMLRIEEQDAKGKVITTDWRVLASEGKVEGAEEWYFQVTGQMLLNGSLSCPNTPTNLNLEKIRDIVKIGVDPASFEPSRTEQCQKGICVSTQHNPCPWYKYGLGRCRKIRYEAKK